MDRPSEFATILAGGGVVWAAAGGTLRLRARVRPDSGPAGAPLATAVLVAATAAGFAAQLAFPSLLAWFRRDPAALAAGQWWRVVSPLLVQSDGWPQAALNLAGLAIVGAVVEPRVGRWRLCALYLIPGLVGQAAGYAWQPREAGSSVAVCGLVGAVWWLLLRPGRGPGRPADRLYPLVGIAAALVLIVVANIHGPPLLAGMALAAAMFPFDGRSRPRRRPRDDRRGAATVALTGGRHSEAAAAPAATPKPTGQPIPVPWCGQ